MEQTNMARRLNFEKHILKSKLRKGLSVKDESEFVRNDVASRWLKEREESEWSKFQKQQRTKEHPASKSFEQMDHLIRMISCRTPIRAIHLCEEPPDTQRVNTCSASYLTPFDIPNVACVNWAVAESKLNGMLWRSSTSSKVVVSVVLSRTVVDSTTQPDRPLLGQRLSLLLFVNAAIHPLVAIKQTALSCCQRFFHQQRS
jgi:hypothetical protein